MSATAESQNLEPHVVITIPTHNRWGEARVALARLAQSDYRNFEVVLVDDGCTDGTSELCAAEFPDVQILNGDGNLWWSGAINKGVEYALDHGADAIIWLNDDNHVEPRTLSQMVESFKRSGERSVICARVKSTLTNADEWVGGPQTWHPDYGTWTLPDLSAEEIPAKHPPGGRGVLIPAECFRELGFVDAQAFPQCWADHDFHYRAMKAGYRYFIARDAVIWNVPNAERKDSPEKFSIRWILDFLFHRRSDMNVIALPRMLKRHFPPREYRAMYYPFLWRSLTWLASGWSARHSVVYKPLRAIRRSFVFSFFFGRRAG